MINFLKFLIFASLLVFLIPAHLYRVVYFDVLVEVMFLIYVWLLVNRRLKFPKISLMGASFFIFIIVSALATIFSVEPAKSFWGVADRSLTGGLFMYLHYFLLFVVLTGVFNNKKEDYLGLFKIVVFIGLFLSIWGFYQAYTGLPRINSLMGNPTYLSNFLIFAIFLSVYLFFVSGKQKTKFFYLGVIPVFLVGIYLALSRGPILGLLTAVGTFVIGLGIYIFRKNQKMALKIVIPSIFALFTIIYFSMPMIEDSVLFGRFKTSLTDASAMTRMANWSTALKAIVEKPILGWGQENFDIVFYKYADSSKFLSDNLNLTWFDRAHNNILDIGVTSGLLGVATYLSIWIAIFIASFYLFKLGRKKESIIFSMFLVAYFVGNLLFFDSLVTFLPFIFVLAFMSDFASDINFRLEKKIENLVNYFKKYFSKENTKVLFGFTMIVGIVCILINAQIARAASHFYDIKFGKGYQFNNALKSYEKVFTITPNIFREDAVYAMVKIIVNNRVDDGDLIDKIDPVIREIDDLSIEHPLDIKPYYYGARMHLLEFELSANNDSLVQAQNLLEHGIKISPTRQVFYMDLARVKMYQNEFALAISNMEKARDLNPDYSRPHFYLTVLYLLNKQDQLAEDSFVRAGERGVIYDKVDIPNLLFIADHFISRGDNNKSIKILEEVIKLDEQNITAIKKLAALYLEIGDKERSRKYAMAIWNIDQSLRKEAEDFMKYIDSK